MLERRSAIASGLAAGGRAPLGITGCHLGEVAGFGLLQVAGFRKTMGEVERVVGTACGCIVPRRLSDTVRAGDLTVLRTGPEQLWIVGPAERLGVEEAIRTGIGPTVGAVTPLSHSRTRIFIEGEMSRDVLAKGIPLDLHADVFAVGEAALTGLDHTPVLLHRVAADRYEIYAMRTFALTVWEWLADAALQYGYEVVAG